MLRKCMSNLTHATAHEAGSLTELGFCQPVASRLRSSAPRSAEWVGNEPYTLAAAGGVPLVCRQGGAAQASWFPQVETTAVAAASTVAQMARLVEQATAAQSPTETLVQRFARVYTPLVLIATACVAFIPWICGKDDHKVGSVLGQTHHWLATSRRWAAARSCPSMMLQLPTARERT